MSEILNDWKSLFCYKYILIKKISFCILHLIYYYLRWGTIVKIMDNLKKKFKIIIYFDKKNKYPYLIDKINKLNKSYIPMLS